MSKTKTQAYVVRKGFVVHLTRNKKREVFMPGEIINLTEDEIKIHNHRIEPVRD